MEKLFVEQVSQLCLNQRYADVTFIIAGERFSGHSAILASRSEYFRALLYGGLSESNKPEIELNVPPEAFKLLLQYIYCMDLRLSSLDVNLLLETMDLAREYGTTELESSIFDHLNKQIFLDNVCKVLDAAKLLHLENLISAALIYIDRHNEEILSHESFKTLSQQSLQLILSRDSFYADEEDIFQAVLKWRTHNPEADMSSILSLMRLPLIKRQTLITTVYESNLISPEKVIEAIAVQDFGGTLPYRAALWPEENVALECYSARTIKGENPTELLNGNYTVYAFSVYCSHEIKNDDVGNNCIMVELGRIHLLNHIKLLLWDKDERYYKYFIEITVDGKNWKRIIDKTNESCRSWQDLCFDACPVKIIKIVGTHNTANDSFIHVVHLEASHQKRE